MYFFFTNEAGETTPPGPVVAPTAFPVCANKEFVALIFAMMDYCPKNINRQFLTSSQSFYPTSLPVGLPTPLKFQSNPVKGFVVCNDNMCLLWHRRTPI